MKKPTTRRATDHDAEGLSELLRDYLRERYSPLLVAAMFSTGCASAAPTQPAQSPTGSVQPSSAAEQVVQTQLDAYNRRDVSAFVATYATDAKLYAHPDRLIGSGIDQMRKDYASLF